MTVASFITAPRTDHGVPHATACRAFLLDAELAKVAVDTVVVTRGGVVDGVIFRTDKGTPHCADGFAKAWERLGIIQSTGRVGAALADAPVESLISTFENEPVTRCSCQTRREAGQDVACWIDDFCNRRRRDSTNGMKPSIDHETEHCNIESETAEAA